MLDYCEDLLRVLSLQREEVAGRKRLNKKKRSPKLTGQELAVLQAVYELGDELTEDNLLKRVNEILADKKLH